MTEVERQLAHSRRAALGETAQAARNRARRTAARDARTDQNHRRPASSTRESADVSAPTARSSRDAGGDWPLPRARSSCRLVPPGRGVRLEQDSRAGCSAQPRAIGRVRVADTSRGIRLTAPLRPTRQRAASRLEALRLPPSSTSSGVNACACSSCDALEAVSSSGGASLPREAAVLAFGLRSRRCRRVARAAAAVAGGP